MNRFNDAICHLVSGLFSFGHLRQLHVCRQSHTQLKASRSLLLFRMDKFVTAFFLGVDAACTAGAGAYELVTTNRVVQTVALGGFALALYGGLRLRSAIKDIQQRGTCAERRDGKDVVYLNCLLRSPFAINPSTFVLKCETFLRLHRISYTVEFPFPPGSKSQRVPYAVIGGEHVEDSDGIIEKLKSVFAAQIAQSATATQKALTPEQHAVGHALRRMCETTVYWWVCRALFVDHPE
jgi:hypothetical protein